ncbi:rod shape-determining protein RodA [Nocardiopsis composta]|uniref:peptidoglycan glycosyltransferase n=1 Tax=Nocardiopsis composta TaxID=157465 RepID=A0A7W8QRJ8_9ACTN|nr:rod shape determining protein RodA [Nocardiopsis composta]
MSIGNQPRPRSSGERAARAIAGALPRRVDGPLLAAVAALIAIGTVLLAAATYTPGDPAEQLHYVERHLLYAAVGGVCCAALVALDHRTVRAYAPIVFVVCSIALVLVLTPLGAVINGTRSWLVIGGLQLQPVEPAKLGLVMMVAVLLGEPRDGEHAPTSRDVLFSLAVLAVPTVLVMLQPDLGSLLVIGATYLGMLALSGAPLRWIAGLAACGVGGLVAVWSLGLLKAYQLARLTSFVDPSSDPLGRGYNANQAMIAVGSGGFTGTGLFQGEQTSGRFVPEQHTDFIFTVAGEELGFVGSTLIIALIGVVLWRILRIASLCAQPYARLLCTGVASWFAFQSFINIGMTIGITPITGIPLPFVSYGGTATIANLAAIGMVLGIGARDRGRS